MHDAITIAPDVYHVVLENDHVRILEVRGTPGTKTGLHTHPAQVAVALTDACYRFTGPDGRSFDATLSAGDTMYLDPVEHSTEILGEPGSRVLLVELKP